VQGKGRAVSGQVSERAHEMLDCDGRVIGIAKMTKKSRGKGHEESRH